MSEFNVDQNWAERIFELLDQRVNPADVESEMETIEQTFGFVSHHLRRRLFELRVQIVFAMLPRECLSDMDSTGRKRAARDHLMDVHGIPVKLATRLGNRLLSLADRLAVTRKDVSGSRSTLREQQRSLCGHCRQNLTVAAETLPADVFKPYRWFPDELSQEVDHIDPISLFGDNKPKNLTLLCKFCNLGKSNSLGLPASDLRRFAAARLPCPPSPEILPFLRRLVYYRIEIDEQTCLECGECDSSPLTVRRIEPTGLLIPKNVRTLCVPCAEEADAQSR